MGAALKLICAFGGYRKDLTFCDESMEIHSFAKLFFCFILWDLSGFLSLWQSLRLLTVIATRLFFVHSSSMGRD